MWPIPCDGVQAPHYGIGREGATIWPSRPQAATYPRAIPKNDHNLLRIGGSAGSWQTRLVLDIRHISAVPGAEYDAAGGLSALRRASQRSPFTLRLMAS